MRAVATRYATRVCSGTGSSCCYCSHRRESSEVCCLLITIVIPDLANFRTCSSAAPAAWSAVLHCRHVRCVQSCGLAILAIGLPWQPSSCLLGATSRLDAGCCSDSIISREPPGCLRLKGWSAFQVAIPLWAACSPQPVCVMPATSRPAKTGPASIHPKPLSACHISSVPDYARH